MNNIGRRSVIAGAVGSLASLHGGAVLAADPIKIGFSMPLTGGLSGGGKSVILAFELWKEDINAKGGLLGRPVELVYFDDQTDTLNAKSATCIAHIRPFSELASDLAGNKVARYNFITPNLCDDMHDSCSGDPIAHGDEWLRTHVPAILSSTAYRSGGALFIVWDEANKGDGPIPLLLLSPFAKGNHYSNTLYYTHSSLLRTEQEIFGVSPLLRDAAKQRDLSDLFQVFP